MNQVEEKTPHSAQRWLITQGVRHTFGTGSEKELQVINELSLEIAKGELVALVGPSGSGKSTLLNIIAGLLKPTHGSVLLDGQDITGTTGHVAYMMQDDLLLPWRTVLDNVTLGPSVAGVSRKESRQRALSLMDKFDLKGFENYYPGALSGGMRQRVAFMRTVLFDKPIMLLDEPFRGLDAFVKVRLHEWLLGLWEEFGLTILFITHDAEEAVFLSDRAYVLSGRPASVKRIVSVDLPRPRTQDMVVSREFAEIKQQVLEPFWQESWAPEV